MSGFSPQMCLAHTGCLKESPFSDLSEIRKSIAQDQHNKSNEPGGWESLKMSKGSFLPTIEFSKINQGGHLMALDLLLFNRGRCEVWGDILSVLSVLQISFRAGDSTEMVFA